MAASLFTYPMVAQNLHSDGILKETILFSTKGSDSLFFDKYTIPGIEGKRGCMMFAFGGGFKWGDRDNKGYIPYFHFLASQGYCVVSIDYRLGLRNPGENKSLKKAIDIAVEDLFDATSYVLKHAEEWNIDKNMILAGGSSAGAIAALQAEYEICNRTGLTSRLPEGFNYAGIISFAGAILDGEGDLTWKQAPCPIQMFHGDKDNLVPYNTIKNNTGGFYGPEYITGKLDELHSPYWLYTAKGGGHEQAEVPMNFNREEIISFLNKLVKQKHRLFIKTEIWK